MLRILEEFLSFCLEHGSTLRNHKKFGEMAREVRAKTVVFENEIEILREFYKTVKSHNVGVGAYFLTFSNKVKDALEVCDEKLSHLENPVEESIPSSTSRSRSPLR